MSGNSPKLKSKKIHVYCERVQIVHYIQIFVTVDYRESGSNGAKIRQKRKMLHLWATKSYFVS